MFLSLALITAFAIHLLNDRSDLFSKTKSVSRNPVWRDYYKSDLPTLVVTGDYFFMSKVMEGKKFILRNTKINSNEEFIQSKLDTLGFSKFSGTYSAYSMGECISNVIPHLGNNKEDFKVKPASLLTWEEVNSYNIIYMGDFKTLYILGKMLPRFNIHYDIAKRSYYLPNALEATITP